jgi:hypothetical protein
VSFISLLAPVLGFAIYNAPQPDTADIVSKMERRMSRQSATLCSYSALETYTLSNRHLHAGSEMKVRVTYHHDKGTKYQVISDTSKGIAKRVFENLLHEQTTAHREKSAGINSSHYEFDLKGEEGCGNRQCYKLQIRPRHRTRFLVDGFAWVDRRTYGIVRVEGRLAKSPSFWIKPPEIEQTFEARDGFWLPASNRSSTHVLFFGEADLTIAYSDYHVKACNTGAPSADVQD